MKLCHDDEPIPSGQGDRPSLGWRRKESNAFPSCSIVPGSGHPLQLQEPMEVLLCEVLHGQREVLIRLADYACEF